YGNVGLDHLLSKESRRRGWLGPAQGNRIRPDPGPDSRSTRGADEAREDHAPRPAVPAGRRKAARPDPAQASRTHCSVLKDRFALFLPGLATGEVRMWAHSSGGRAHP